MPVGFLPLVAAFIGLKIAEGTSDAKSADSERDALKARRKLQQVQNAIARREMVQDAFTAYTRSKANAVDQGADTSTVGSGAQSSIASQFAFNVDVFGRQAGLQDTAFSETLDAAKWGGFADIFGNTASIMSMGFGGSRAPSSTGTPVEDSTIYQSEYPI